MEKWGATTVKQCLIFDVAYYHCSEFQIPLSLSGLNFSVLSFYHNSVQNQAWFCLHFSDHSKPKQTDVILSCFVSLSLVNQGRRTKSEEATPWSVQESLMRGLGTGMECGHRVFERTETALWKFISGEESIFALLDRPCNTWSLAHDYPNSSSA